MILKVNIVGDQQLFQVWKVILSGNKGGRYESLTQVFKTFTVVKSIRGIFNSFIKERVLSYFYWEFR